MQTQANDTSWSLVDDKGTWSVRIRIYDPSKGRKVQKSVSTGYKVAGSNKRKAEKKAKELVQAVEDEMAAKATVYTGPLDFSWYIHHWLENTAKTVRPNTLLTYTGYAERNIIPVLGAMPVTDITWRVLQAFWDDYLETHTVSSAKKINVLVKGALDDAVRDGVIQSNPQGLVKWRKAEKFEGSFLHEEDVSRLLDAAKEAGEPICAAVTLALCYGMRRSEVCGLRWMDIDFAKGTMHIQHTLVQDGALVLDDDHTKTLKSNRVLTLIPSTVDYLKQVRAEQLKSGRVLDKVLAWPDGRMVRPDHISRAFKHLLRDLGLDTNIRFHDLRHTTASLLAKSGLGSKELQNFLGHEDIETTLGIYTHLLTDGSEAASAAMDAVLSNLGQDKNRVKKCSEICSETAVSGG